MSPTLTLFGLSKADIMEIKVFTCDCCIVGSNVSSNQRINGDLHRLVHCQSPTLSPELGGGAVGLDGWREGEGGVRLLLSVCVR